MTDSWSSAEIYRRRYRRKYYPSEDTRLYYGSGELIEDIVETTPAAQKLKNAAGRLRTILQKYEGSTSLVPEISSSEVGPSSFSLTDPVGILDISSRAIAYATKGVPRHILFDKAVPIPKPLREVAHTESELRTLEDKTLPFLEFLEQLQESAASIMDDAAEELEHSFPGKTALRQFE